MKLFCQSKGFFTACTVFAAILLFAMAGASISSGTGDKRFRAYVETHPDGWIDWDNGVIYGVGRAYLDKKRTSRNKALQGAKLIALQSILKTAAGIRLDDRETLESLGNGEIVIRLRGRIKYEEHETKFVEDAKRPYLEVTRRAAVNGVEGLTATILDQLKSSPVPWNKFPKQPAGVSEEDIEETETWLVLDGRKLPNGEKVRPALFPTIASTTGETLYDLEMVDEDALYREGMMKYVLSDSTAEDLSSDAGTADRLLSAVKGLFSARDAMAGEKKKRKRRRRFIIKDVRKARGLNKTNLVISEEDAKKLKKEEVSGKILKKCKVIVVVNSSIGGIEGGLPSTFASLSGRF